MARLEWSRSALLALEHLVRGHGLPSDTRDRVEESARPLGRFPRFGPQIEVLSDGAELRFLIGTWPWLVIVYLYIEGEDRIVVASVEDGRAATAAVAARRPELP